MELLTLGVIGVIVMMALIFAGMPIGFALAFVGAGGNVLLMGLAPTAAQVGLITWENGSNFLLISAPLFIFMGLLVFHTGIASDLYDCVYKWFGRLPGGLAVTATATCAGFGAVTGSSIAAVATVGAMVMPEMRKCGYHPRLAAGSVAAGGTLAILIPPSFIMILYGVWTETSIGKLFIAGIIPGLILTSAFIALITVRSMLNPALGPKGPRFSWHERLTSLWKLVPTLAVFLLVIGGIYGGIFTATEAAAIGAIGVMVVAAVMGRLSWKALKLSLSEAGHTSGMIFIIIIGGVLVSRFLVQTGLTPALVTWISELGIGATGVLLLLIVLYLILGCMLDTMGTLILTLPFVMPVVLELGIDPVWFGVFVTIMIELALVTPPVGLNVYVLNNIAPEVDVMEIFRGCYPFVAVMIAVVFLLMAFPQLVLWLPESMGK
ncbi:TRAP transporter large permease [Devosia sp.]|uniref:TRAP transporter large permease n=1 Tax=Devosia sp. TaxID=1871048 RepID=UPI002EFD0839